MPLITGLDVETSGLDSVKDRIIECGAVLYDWDSATPLLLQSDLVDARVPLSQEIVQLTGITEQMLDSYGKSEEQVFSDLHSLIHKGDYVMAHFGNDFDQKFCRETFARLNIEWPEKLWLDTSIDCVYPKSVTTRNLRYLAAEIGFVQTFRHRAVFDVLTMFAVAGEFQLEKIISRAKEPTLCVQALVSFDEKEKAKEKGYRWHGATKMWWKNFKQSDYLAEKDTCGFQTRLLEKVPE